MPIPQRPFARRRKLPRCALALAGSLALWSCGERLLGERAALAAPASPPVGAPAASPERPAALPPGPPNSAQPLRWRGALQLAAANLAKRPDWPTLDPDRYPPLFEAMLQDSGTVRVRYRQELEMSYGTLVAVVRGEVVLGQEGGPTHRNAPGPLPASWTKVPPPVGRQAWRDAR